MALLRTIKDEFSYYHHLKLDTLVALNAENQKKLVSFLKANKGARKKENASIKVQGYRFVMDTEFESLKIDFSQTYSFNSSDLVKAK